MISEQPGAKMGALLDAEMRFCSGVCGVCQYAACMNR